MDVRRGVNRTEQPRGCARLRWHLHELVGGWEPQQPPARPIDMTASHVLRAILIVSVAASAACMDSDGDGGQDAVAAAASDEWPSMVHHGACGALFVYAHDDSETHAVTVALSDVTYEEVEAGLSLTVDLPHPSVEVELVEGVQVDDPLCNDMVGDAHRVDRTSVPSNGHLALGTQDGSVQVQRLELHLDSGSEVVVQPFEVPIGTVGG